MTYFLKIKGKLKLIKENVLKPTSVQLVPICLFDLLCDYILESGFVVHLNVSEDGAK